MKQGYDNDVGDFHRKFGLPTSDHEAGPREISDELLAYRIRFLREELDEFIEAAEEMDHARMFDGLLDLVYVALGTAHMFGYPWRDGWNEVQRANMAKERATSVEQSTRGTTLDVIKPEGWTPPDIAGVLRAVGFD